MSAIALMSAAGAPGVTTTALGFTLLWPTDALLVDADPHPSQAILAGYLGGSDGSGRGIAAVASAQRDRQLRPVDLLAHCVPLSAETARQRLFLPGFARPGSHHALAGALPAVGQALRTLAERGTQVIIDAGRFGDGSPQALMQVASTVLILTRTNLRALAALRLYLSTITRLVETARVELILIGPGQPYTAAEIAAQFDLPVRGAIADDPAGAAVLSDARPAPRRFTRGAYARSLRTIADQLAAEDDRQRLEAAAR